MSVKIRSETLPGDLYVDEHGQVYRLLSYCTQPTATMENVSHGSKVCGAIGSHSLQQFTEIADMTSDELVKIVTRLAFESRRNLEDRLVLKEEIIDLKERLYDLRVQSDPEWPHREAL